MYADDRVPNKRGRWTDVAAT